MFKQLLLIVFILVNGLAYTQFNGNWGLEARFKPGFLLGHRVVMGHLPTDHTFATELGFVFRTNGEKSWHQHYKYPEIGVNLYYGSVGNTAILGNFVGLYSNLHIPFVAQKKFRLSGKIGAGLAYTPKVYDETNAPKNVAMSTHFNALINFGLDAKIFFNKNWIVAGIEVLHFSNAGYRVPNLGLNIPQLSIGYGRFINKVDDYSPISKENAVPQRKILLGLTGIASMKEIFPTNGRQYPIFALSLHARTFLKPRVGWELAFDVISKQAIKGYHPEIDKNQWDMVQMGVYAGYLLPLNQFHFVLGMGTYLKDKYKPEGQFYHRIGLRYYLKNGIFMNLVLKSHWGKADYCEYGIGYSFFNISKKNKK